MEIIIFSHLQRCLMIDTQIYYNNVCKDHWRSLSKLCPSHHCPSLTLIWGFYRINFSFFEIISTLRLIWIYDHQFIKHSGWSHPVNPPTHLMTPENHRKLISIVKRRHFFHCQSVGGNRCPTFVFAYRWSLTLYLTLTHLPGDNQCININTIIFRKCSSGAVVEVKNIKECLQTRRGS